MTAPNSQDAGDPSDEQELDPSTLSDEELKAYFTGEAVSEETPESVEPVEQTQEETEAGDTAEETSPDVESEQERLAKMRVRPKDDQDQQILDLYKSEGFSGTLADAAIIINGGTAPVAEKAPEPEPTVNNNETLLKDLDSKIAELQEKAHSASEDLDTAQAFQLQQQIMDHRIEKVKVEQQIEREKEREEERAYDTYRQKAVESRDRVYEKYPVLQNKNSTERKLFDQFVNDKQNDPDYSSVFDSPRWVELMANEFANENALAKSTDQVSLENLNRPPKTNTKVLTSASNTSTVSKQPTITPKGIRDNMDRLDRDTLYSMLGQ